jgi:site-specific DNA recombinase
LQDKTSRVDASLKPAVGYVRRSTDRQEQSLGDQQAILERYAAAHQFEILRFYTDDAITGTSLDGREAFKKMLEDSRASNRTWRFILVFDVSRFSRGDMDEAGYLRHQLRKAGIEVVYCAEHFTGTDSDDLVLSVKQWQAQQFVKDLSRVTIRGQVSHSETGAWCGGTPPFGYDLLYADSSGSPYQQVRWLASGEKEVYDPSGKLQRIVPRGEALSTSKRDRAHLVPSTRERLEIIQRIFRECVEQGRGFRSIADRLNRDGIPSPRDGNWSANTGSKWSVGTIRSILRNPAYRGDTAWNRRTFAKFHRVGGGSAVQRPKVEAGKPRENRESDWIVVAGTHEPLIPPAMFDRAQELTQARGRKASPHNFRAGSGLRSPYLLSGLVECGRCHQKYQGRGVNSTKRRTDGSKIRTLYYACGGFVMKGSSACEKLLLRKDPLEEALLTVVRDQLGKLLKSGGERILRKCIEEELGAQGQDPRREMEEIRTRLEEIDRKADVLLEGMSPEAQAFVDNKLRALSSERKGLKSRLEALGAVSYEPVDVEAVLRQGMASLRDLPRVMEFGSLEERKEFIRAFVTGITVHPEQRRLEVRIRKIPAALLPQPGSSVGLVAGAGFEPATFGL